MKLPKISKGKLSFKRELNPELEEQSGSRAETKLELLSLPEEERIRAGKEIRGILQRRILERKSESILLHNAGY